MPCLFDLDEEEKEEGYDECDSDENPAGECTLGLLGNKGGCLYRLEMGIVIG